MRKPNNIIITTVSATLITVSILVGQQTNIPKRYGLEIENREKGLETIRKQIRENEKAEQRLSGKEKSVHSELQNVEQKMDLTTKLLDQLALEEAELDLEVSDIANELIRTEERLAQKKDVLYRRLSNMYRQGREHELKILLGAGSFTDLLQRFYYITLIAKADKRLIGQVEQLRQEIIYQKAERENRLAKMVKYREEKEIEKSNLVKSATRRKNLLSSIKNEKLSRQKAVAQLHEQAKKLTSLIEELEQKRLAAIEREKERVSRESQTIVSQLARGSTAWPVEGKIVAKFGTVENETYQTKIINSGIDIAAEPGTPVKAIGDGKVRFADWYLAYGKMIILDHGGGLYSLYGHVSDVLVNEGDTIEKNQIIARVGNTGSLDGSKLHFEIREGRNAVDPLTWLAAIN